MSEDAKASENLEKTQSRENFSPSATAHYKDFRITAEPGVVSPFTSDRESATSQIDNAQQYYGSGNNSQAKNSIQKNVSSEPLTGPINDSDILISSSMGRQEHPEKAEAPASRISTPPLPYDAKNRTENLESHTLQQPHTAAEDQPSSLTFTPSSPSQHDDEQAYLLQQPDQKHAEKPKSDTTSLEIGSSEGKDKEQTHTEKKLSNAENEGVQSSLAGATKKKVQVQPVGITQRNVWGKLLGVIVILSGVLIAISPAFSWMLTKMGNQERSVNGLSVIRLAQTGKEYTTYTTFSVLAVGVVIFILGCVLFASQRTLLTAIVLWGCAMFTLAVATIGYFDPWYILTNFSEKHARANSGIGELLALAGSSAAVLAAYLATIIGASRFAKVRRLSVKNPFHEQ